MKIKKSNIKNHIGSNIIVAADDNSYIPSGTYFIMDADNDGGLFYNIVSQEIFKSNLNHTKTITKLITSPSVSLELMEESITKYILQLMTTLANTSDINKAEIISNKIQNFTSRLKIVQIINQTQTTQTDK